MEIGKVYGYVRVSTPKQSMERQIRNIKTEYPDAIIVQDEYTGTKMQRPNWMKLYQRLSAGDMIIFDSVSRMSRNAEDGFATYEELYEKGVTLVFLKEPHINTDTYRNALATGISLTGTTVDFILQGVNQYLMALAKEQLRLAFEQAEKEVSDLQQRTKEGLETARLNGKQIGQVKGAKLTTQKAVAIKKVIRLHSKDFDGTLSDKDCIKLIGCARGTYYKYKGELRNADEWNEV